MTPDRAMSLLRRHLGLVVMLVVATGVRAVVLATYWPAEFNADSLGYMASAFAGWLHPSFGTVRPSGYGLFMAAIPGWRHLWPVAAVQHLLGLLAGVAVYVTAVRWRVPRWGALLAAAVVLLDPLELALEQFILADVLAAMLVLAACVALIWAPRISTSRAAAAGALIAAAALTRTVALPLLALGVVAVVVAATHRVRATAAFLATAMVLLSSYVLVYHSQHGSYSTTSWGTRFLYARIGLYIDCTKLTLPDYEKQACPYGVPTDERTPNLFLWQTDAYLNRLVPPPGMSDDQLLSDFNHRALRQQPLAYMAVIARDSVRAFQPTRSRSYDDGFDQQWHLSRHHEINLVTKRSHRLLAGEITVRTWSGGVKWLARYDHFYTPGPLLALALLLALASLLRPRRGNDRPRLAVAVCATTAIAVIVLPAATASFSWRYLVGALTLIPLAGAIGVRQLLERGKTEGHALPADSEGQPLARSTAL